MKLRNKKTGKVLEMDIHCIGGKVYESLSEISEDWEDYKEPEDSQYWYIDDLGRIQFSCKLMDELEDRPNNCMIRKLYGNYFNSREEAEKAVEKLKAWKRLKDKGFRFKGLDSFGNIRFETDDKYKYIHLNLYPFRKFKKDEGEFLDDLYLLFGGEE